MKIAQIQMHVSGDKTADLRRAAELIRGAGEIDLAVLPEMFCCPYDNSCFHRYGAPHPGVAPPPYERLRARTAFKVVPHPTHTTTPHTHIPTHAHAITNTSTPYQFSTVYLSYMLTKLITFISLHSSLDF